MYSRTIFPQEIYDLILDTVPYVSPVDSYLEHRKTAPALLNCSLVCSSFRAKAQKRLFHDVSIHFPNSESNSSCRRNLLNQILMSNERLRNFVIKLRIVLEPALPISYASFPSLRNLAHLNITGDNLEEPLDWSWMLSSDWETCKSDIFKMMHVPTLRTLKIYKIFEFPVGVLLTCGQVQELYVDLSSVTLDGNSNTTDSDLLPMLPVQQGYLEGLDFSYYTFPLLVEALRSNPSSSLSIARLQKLRLSIFERETEEAVQEVLKIAAASLKHLEICFEPFFEASWETLNLPDPSILRHLTFSVTVWEDYWNINSFLEQMPTANNLAGMLIYLHSDCADDSSTWQQLDKLLARMAQFQCLEVRVGSEWTDLGNDLPELLPRLAGSGQLVVTYQPSYSNPITVHGIGPIDT
ncbi:hypothetical protein C0995_002498 [Termitomyces sp. Mi166|nr:hypothetical protein C0995_002498 [Termitomyces sp. Mi166\